MLQTKEHKSKYSVLGPILSIFLVFIFHLRTQARNLVLLLNQKNYISCVLGSLKHLIVCLSRRFLLKMMLSHTLHVFERRREQSGVCVFGVIAHNEKFAMVAVTTGTGTICSLWDITSPSFLI